MSKFLMMRVTGDGNPNWGEYGDVDLAYAELTEKLCGIVQQRHALLREARNGDGKLYEMWYWDGWLTWCERPLTWDNEPDEDDEFGEKDLAVTRDPFDWDADDMYVLLDNDPKIPEARERRVELDQMVITDEYVRWVAVRRHHDTYITTERVPLSAFGVETKSPATV